MYARTGVIESLASTNRFGDVESDDLSLKIENLVDSFDNWVIAYNQRVHRVYCLPENQSQLWVYHLSLVGSELSPWVKWTTQHNSSFNPTAMMTCLDPQDGLQKVYFGDSAGNVYALEGEGEGDAGSTDITVERLSGLLTVPAGAQMFQLEGWLRYRKNEEATVSLTFEFAGKSAFNETITINLPDVESAVYGGAYYYGGDTYYGAAFAQRLTLQEFLVPGQAESVQVRVSVTGRTDIELNEIGLRLGTAA
jgi:hypothetical protein